MSKEKEDLFLKYLREDLKPYAKPTDCCEYIVKFRKENERLKSIIKEVREYIQKNCILSDEWTDLGFCNFIPTGKITYKQLTSKKVKGLLEILDKENNND